MQFETVVNGLAERKLSFEVIDTNKLNYSSKISAYFNISREYITSVKRQDTVIYFSSTNYKYFLPLFNLARYLKPHKLILRKIGGDLVHDLKKSSVHRLYISSLLNRIDLILTESKGLEVFLVKNGLNAEQFLNARKKPNNTLCNRNTESFKIAYIGRLAKTKGVQKLLVASKELSGTIINVYGPIENVSSDIFTRGSNVNYCKSFINSEIYSVLSEYDAVILPSEFRGEGHPGILIEALMAGKPVIATDINYNSEVVKDGYNGVLIKNNSIDEIVQGINRLRAFDYDQLSKNAVESSARFDIDVNVDRIIELTQ